MQMQLDSVTEIELHSVIEFKFDYEIESIPASGIKLDSTN